MPKSVAAVSMRSRVPAFQHLELYSPAPGRRLTAAVRDSMKEIQHPISRHSRMLEGSGLKLFVGPGGSPILSPDAAASGHLSTRDIQLIEKTLDGRDV